MPWTDMQIDAWQVWRVYLVGTDKGDRREVCISDEL